MRRCIDLNRSTARLREFIVITLVEGDRLAAEAKLREADLKLEQAQQETEVARMELKEKETAYILSQNQTSSQDF